MSAAIEPPPVAVVAGFGLEAGESVAGLARVGLELPLAGRVTVGAQAEVGVLKAPASAIGAGVLGADMVLWNGVSARAAVGAGWRAGVVPVARLGVGWRLPRTALRLDVGVQHAGSWLGTVGVDLLAPLRARPVRVELVPDTPDPLVWVPHPVCEWLPAVQAEELLARLGPSVAIEEEPPAPTPVAPGFGTMVIIAAPGDWVSVAGAPVETGQDGTALLLAAEGPVVVEVEGGGRRQRLEGATSSGYTLWLRAGEPLSVVVPFGTDPPSDLDQRLRPWIDLRGDHGIEVVGTWTPGESPTAARMRAELVISALYAAGLPKGAVVREAAEEAPEARVTVQSGGAR